MTNGDLDVLYEKWVRWFDRIRNETHGLWLYRHFWDGLVEITGAVELPASGIFDAFGWWYSAAQTLGVRRQLDRDPRAISLARLLDDIASHPEVMTRERYVAMYGDDPLMVARGEEGFDALAGIGQRTVDPARTRDDLRTLSDAAEPIKHFVDRVVAHTDHRGAHAMLTFGG